MAYNNALHILQLLSNIEDIEPSMKAMFASAAPVVTSINQEWQAYSATHPGINVHGETVVGMHQLIEPLTAKLRSFGLDPNDDAFRGPMFQMMAEDFVDLEQLQNAMNYLMKTANDLKDDELKQNADYLSVMYLRAMFLVLSKLASFNFYCAHDRTKLALTNYFAQPGPHDCPINTEAMTIQNSCILPCQHVFSKNGMTTWARRCIKARNQVSCPKCRYRTTFGYIDCQDPQYAKIRHYTPTDEEWSSARPAGGGHKRKTMSKNKKHKVRKSRKSRKSRRSYRKH
jgi:hypothetical protein